MELLLRGILGEAETRKVAVDMQRHWREYCPSFKVAMEVIELFNHKLQELRGLPSAEDVVKALSEALPCISLANANDTCSSFYKHIAQHAEDLG